MGNKILIFSNSLTGIYSFRREVVQTIVESGYETTICCPPLQHEAIDYFTRIGCNIRYVQMEKRGTNPIHDIKLIRVYKKIIKEVKPLAVLTYSIKCNIYGGIAANLCHIPQIANITGLGDALENPGLLQKITIALYKIGLKKASIVFYQNQAIQSFCNKYSIGKRGFLLPGSGVNTQWHSLQPYPEEEGPINFLYMGRFMKDKGTDELLEAIKAIRAKYKSRVEFVLIGSRYPESDSTYEAKIEELQRQGVLSWPGIAKDVRPYIKDAWCTIQPSYHEGMSNVNLESAANGRPIITTNVPGCKETVDDGRTGYLIEPRNADSLINTIESFIMLPYSQKVLMGQNARAKIEKEFDRQIVVETYLNEIHKLENV